MGGRGCTRAQVCAGVQHRAGTPQRYADAATSGRGHRPPTAPIHGKLTSVRGLLRQLNMQTSRRKWGVVLAMASALGGAACTSTSSPLSGDALNHEFEGIASGRAALEFPCPDGSLTVEDLPGYAYRVTGCGAYATYECDYGYAQGSNDDWLYICDRAAQDDPERFADAGASE